MQGSGLVGQHTVRAVESLFAPLLFIDCHGDLLPGRDTCLDDQGGGLEEGGHSGVFLDGL